MFMKGIKVINRPAYAAANSLLRDYTNTSTKITAFTWTTTQSQSHSMHMRCNAGMELLKAFSVCWQAHIVATKLKFHHLSLQHKRCWQFNHGSIFPVLLRRATHFITKQMESEDFLTISICFAFPFVFLLLLPQLRLPKTFAHMLPARRNFLNQHFIERRRRLGDV